jgi:hypothetical protein
MGVIILCAESAGGTALELYLCTGSSHLESTLAAQSGFINLIGLLDMVEKKTVLSFAAVICIMSVRLHLLDAGSCHGFQRSSSRWVGNSISKTTIYTLHVDMRLADKMPDAEQHGHIPGCIVISSNNEG